MQIYEYILFIYVIKSRVSPMNTHMRHSQPLCFPPPPADRKGEPRRTSGRDSRRLLLV